MMLQVIRVTSFARYVLKSNLRKERGKGVFNRSISAAHSSRDDEEESRERESRL